MNFDDNEPITEEWLLELGFKHVTSNMGPEYDDHLEKDGLNVWEFSGTGNWLWTDCDSVEMCTRRHLRLLFEWLGMEFESVVPPTTDELLAMEEVYRQSDNSWRHGTYETVVFRREPDNTYWEVQYCLSADGETNELREGLVNPVRVKPVKKTVTKYVSFGSQN